MKGLYLLFSFMTRVPMPDVKFSSQDLGKSMKYFPVVGLVIGVILYLVARGVALVTGSSFPFLLSVFVLLLEVLMTGGLHLDGLADTFDGMFSYRSKQKILEIMKDSRLGTNGALALVFYFLLKWSVFAELFYKLGKNDFAIFLVTMPIVARLGSVIHCAYFPYARGTGMGKTFVDNTTKKDLGISILITTVMLAVLWSSCKEFSMVLALTIATLILASFQFFFGKVVEHRIGGITGDTLGAVVELSEVVFGLILYVVVHTMYYVI